MKSERNMAFAMYCRLYPRCPFTTYGTDTRLYGHQNFNLLWRRPIDKRPQITLSILARGALDPRYLAPPSKTLQPGYTQKEYNPTPYRISLTIHLLLKYSPLPIVPRGTLFNPNYSPTQTSRKPPFMVTLRHVSSIRCNSSWCRTRRL